MKFFIVLFALIAAAFARPQFGFGGPQFGGIIYSIKENTSSFTGFVIIFLNKKYLGSASNAAAGSQTFK